MAKKIIGRYEIQSEIGRGGMAAVFLAYDPSFRRAVAIKLVASDHQANDVYRERFKREAHLIAKIEHPAIVPVYDYGEYNNNLYLVMRYMPGGTLSDKIKKGTLSLRDVVHIISQIAPALDAVHSQGIVHRDLKPGNILLDSFGNPAISDFGIAHFTSATTDLTGSAIIGTPAYMSPEQVRGDANLDGRSDIYALGIILFEMLTGRGPFRAKTPLGIALQHLTDPIPSLRFSRPNLPLEMERILNKALAKEREMRYAKASDLALDLQSVIDSFREAEPVQIPVGGEAATEADPGEKTEPNVAVSGTTHHYVGSVPSTENSLQIDSAKTSPQKPIAQSVQPEKPARRWGPLQIAILVGIGLFLFFLCGSLGLLGTWAGLRLPSLFSARNQTAPIPVTGSESGSGQDIVLFSDDFTDPNSGWPEDRNAQGSYAYGPDGYHILVNGMDQVLWASTDRVYDNVSLYVDATTVTVGVSGYYGLLCRIQNEQNFYYFVIQENGGYTIGKYKDGEFSSFFPGGWRQSDAIQRGNQTNRLQADCTGNTLRLSVNNVMLGEAIDTDFTSGFSGILAAALGEQDFEVRFNNFLMTKAGQ